MSLVTFRSDLGHFERVKRTLIAMWSKSLYRSLFNHSTSPSDQMADMQSEHSSCSSHSSSIQAVSSSHMKWRPHLLQSAITRSVFMVKRPQLRQKYRFPSSFHSEAQLGHLGDSSFQGTHSRSDTLLFDACFFSLFFRSRSALLRNALEILTTYGLYAD